MRACVHACVRVCACACMRACVRACVRDADHTRPVVRAVTQSRSHPPGGHLQESYVELPEENVPVGGQLASIMYPRPPWPRPRRRASPARPPPARTTCVRPSCSDLVHAPRPGRAATNTGR